MIHNIQISSKLVIVVIIIIFLNETGQLIYVCYSSYDKSIQLKTDLKPGSHIQCIFFSSGRCCQMCMYVEV